MKLDEYIPKNEFIEAVKGRITARYTVFMHSAATIVSLCASFYFTYISHPDSINKIWVFIAPSGQYELMTASFLSILWVNLGSFAVFLFICKFFFGGLSISTTPFYVYYKHSPVDFLKYYYLFSSFLAAVISCYNFPFVKDGTEIQLTPIEALYFISGIFSTTGSNIYPNSNVTYAITIAIHSTTLIFIVYLFKVISELKINKKLYHGFKDDLLGSWYDRIIGYIDVSELTEHQKMRALKYFRDRFDFDRPEGLEKEALGMEGGDFSFLFNVSLDEEEKNLTQSSKE